MQAGRRHMQRGSTSTRQEKQTARRKAAGAPLPRARRLPAARAAGLAPPPPLATPSPLPAGARHAPRGRLLGGWHILRPPAATLRLFLSSFWGCCPHGPSGARLDRCLAPHRLPPTHLLLRVRQPALLVSLVLRLARRPALQAAPGILELLQGRRGWWCAGCKTLQMRQPSGAGQPAPIQQASPSASLSPIR